MQLNVSEVAEEIKLSRGDAKSWGFRVTGGLDFGTPLTVIKVAAGSLAELAGMKVGDMLLQANGQPLSHLTHHESYKFLQEAGNFIELSIVRGSLVLPPAMSSEPSVEGTGTESEADKEVETHNENPENEEPPPPPKPKVPSLFETIFGPLDEPPTERCKSAFEELVEELTKQKGEGVDNVPESNPDGETATENTVPETVVQDEVSGITERSVDAATATAAAVVTAAVAAASAIESAVIAVRDSPVPDSTTGVTTENVEITDKSQPEENADQQQNVPEEIKKEVTEEEFEEIMLGHAEVVKGKAIGVDFEKMVVQNTEVIEQSKVLKILKEEETEPEKKKLSTFLIAPDRPKIKPKEKPKKPKEPPKQEGIEQSTESPKQEGKASDDNKNKESNENESQLVNEENVLNKEEEQPKEEQNIEQGSADIELSSENQRKDEPNDDQNKEAECTQENIPEAEKQPDDKLTAIQNQLAALLQLPSTMQQQLAVIQQEICNLMQQKNEELNGTITEMEESQENPEGIKESKEGVPQTSEELQNDEADESQKTTHEDEVGNQPNEEGEKDPSIQREQEGDHVEQMDTATSENPTADTQEQSAETQPQEGEEPEENPTEGRKRDIQWQHERPKKNKPFFPLTPQPRPIVLPARLRLKMNPESTYSDEFIAETLSGNAEIIMGTTIGINFMKYTPKHTIDHLKTSSVFRMIQESEQKSPGVVGQQEKNLAAEDVKKVEEPVSDV